MLYPLSYEGRALRKTWLNTLSDYSPRLDKGGDRHWVAVPDRVADRGGVVGWG